MSKALLAARFSHWKDHIYYGIRAPIAYRNWWAWPMPKLGRSVLLETRQGVRYFVRAHSPDLSVINESVIRNPYLPDGSAILSDDSVVIDVGANIGDFSMQVAKRCPKGRIYAIEPIPDHVDMLNKNIELNGVDNITVIQAALGREEGFASMQVAGVQSRFAANAHGDNIPTITVRVTTLSSLMKSLGIGRVDLLKLDCEGAELDIMLGASAVVDSIYHISLEYHLSGRYSLDELIQWLQSHGFRVSSRGRGWLGLLWADRLPLADNRT